MIVRERPTNQLTTSSQIQSSCLAHSEERILANFSVHYPDQGHPSPPAAASPVLRHHTRQTILFFSFSLLKDYVFMQDPGSFKLDIVRLNILPILQVISHSKYICIKCIICHNNVAFHYNCCSLINFILISQLLLTILYNVTF